VIEMTENYDVAIIGLGPAAVTAAIYSSRYMLKTVVIGKSAGGTIAQAHNICNFPTYNSITGFDITQKMMEQLKYLEVPVSLDTVESVKKKGKLFHVKGKNKEYTAKKVIYALGTEKRHLGVPGEVEFRGRGVSYCATCDGPFFRDKVVGVVGGSDAALTAALLLSQYAKKVYIIYRREKIFRAEPAWVKLAEEDPKIKFIFKANVTGIYGNDFVEEITLDTGKKMKVDGLFIEVGSIPNSNMLKELGVETDEDGYVKIDREQRTKIKGVMACGDVTDSPLKQAITAAGDGAVAANTAYEEIRRGV
jgi:thioredoxin reductase (NADPH)